jgi:hypothetical protein
VSCFDVILRTEGSLHPDGEPDRFISHHTGIIRRTREGDHKTATVGLVRAYRIHGALAEAAGESLFDVCDCHSQEMHNLYAALFDPEGDGLREDIRESFDVLDPDILVLDHVLLAPRWRGLKLGLMVARKMIDLLGGGCGLAVCWAYPLNPDAGEFAKVPAGWIPRHGGEAEEMEARQKLRRHFGRMGFRRVGRTRYDALSVSQATPTLEDIVRPGR